MSGMNGEIFDCLKRERDICVKAIKPSQNTAFLLNPTLTEVSAEYRFSLMIMLLLIQWLGPLFNTAKSTTETESGITYKENNPNSYKWSCKIDEI